MRRPFLTDAGIALAVALVLIIVAPGLAVVGLVALLVLLLSVLSFALELRRIRRRPRSARRDREKVAAPRR